MEQGKQTVRNSSNSESAKTHSSTANFEILKKIGEGSYSSVFKVRRLVNNHLYALKQIRITHLSKKDMDSALNEVRLLASFHHPNIIAYKQTFYEKGSLYLVLEYADRGDLSNLIEKQKRKNQPFEQTEIWQVLLQMTQALFVLHQSNIIHRDVKPANIFLFGGGQAKLGDLNVSKIYSNQLCLTQTGTPYYASPQIWSEKPYDKKCDIWSLGCSLYEMATLSPPFLGEDMEEIYQNITNQQFQPLPEHYSKDLNKILAKMLEKDPKKRISAQSIILTLSKSMPKELKKQPFAVKTLNLSSSNLKKHRKDSSQPLLKTIVLPKGKNKKAQNRRLNDYLPTSVYSREKQESEDDDKIVVRKSVNFGEIIKVPLSQLRRVSDYGNCATDKARELVSIYRKVPAKAKINEQKVLLPSIRKK